MKSIFVIEYDNGMDYEDHSRRPILTCQTKERAEQIVEEINEWVKKTKEIMPKRLAWDADFSDEQYNQWVDEGEKVKQWLKELKAPYDIKVLIEMITNDGPFTPYLTIEEIPFIK